MPISLITSPMAVALVALWAVQGSSAAAIQPVTTAPTLTRVQAVTAVIPNADATALAPAPSHLDADVKSFLDKYQPDANEAAMNATAAGLHNFPNEGLCTQGYPCFSVSHVGLVDIQGAARLTTKQIDPLLQTILSHGEIPLDQSSNPQTILSGTKFSAADYTLEVIAPAGSICASRLVGTVADLVKVQGFRTTSNAVRGVGVGGGADGKDLMGLCLFPKQMEGQAVTNFCYGKELDGTLSSVSTGSPTTLTRRFSLLSIAAGFCSIIDIPLICPSEHKE